MSEPDQILRTFVHQLPDSIKETVLAQCYLAFVRLEPKLHYDLAAEFDEILNSGDGAWRAFQVAKLVGVIEVLLSHDEEHRQILEELAAEHPGNNMFSIASAQAPLRERHMAAARKVFSELRDGILSAEHLRRWWHVLQAQEFAARQPVCTRPTVHLFD